MASYGNVERLPGKEAEQPQIFFSMNPIRLFYVAVEIMIKSGEALLDLGLALIEFSDKQQPIEVPGKLLLEFA